jgi:uncharacterized protein YndB with AHSA1/START domain
MASDAPPPIRLELATTATPAEAWAALTDPTLVAAWFTRAGALGPPGAPYRLDFGEGSLIDGVVLEHDPGRSFSHTWRWIDAGPGPETRVRWVVEPLDDGARIVLEHDGWDAGADPDSRADAAARDDHADYWAGYLEALHDLLAGPRPAARRDGD